MSIVLGTTVVFESRLLHSSFVNMGTGLVCTGHCHLLYLERRQVFPGCASIAPLPQKIVTGASPGSASATRLVASSPAPPSAVPSRLLHYTSCVAYIHHFSSEREYRTRVRDTITTVPYYLTAVRLRQGNPQCLEGGTMPITAPSC